MRTRREVGGTGGLAAMVTARRPASLPWRPAQAAAPAPAPAPAEPAADPRSFTLPPLDPSTVACLPPPPFVPPPPTPGAGRRDPRRALVALSVVASLLAVVCGATFALARGEATASVEHPDVWDPRLAELVAFVEQERGLSFAYPVFLDEVAAGEVGDHVRTAMSSASPEQLQTAVTEAARLRALGLLGDTDPADLLELRAGLAAERAVVHYDPAANRITLAAAPWDAQQRAKLVHELTHALQDQHFDLRRTAASAPAPLTFEALAEGDARRIERRFVATFGEADRRAYDAAEARSSAAFDVAAAKLPPVVVALALAPSVLGEGMVDTLVDLAGAPAVDSTFRHPPMSDEALLDPGYYRGAGSIVESSNPLPRAGESVAERGTLGPLTWYLLLSDAVDPATALRATFGWGGDRFVLVQEDDGGCVRASYRGDRTADLAELQPALQQWAAAPGASGRQVVVIGDELRVTACGAASPAVPGAAAPAALSAPRRVMDTAAALYRDRGMPYQRARCLAIEFVAGPEPSLEQFLAGAGDRCA